MFGWLSKFAGFFSRREERFRVLAWDERKRPKDYAGVASRVPIENVLEVIAILRGGEKVADTEREPDHCLLCGQVLGVRDLTRLGFQWAQKVEHYVVVHDVWTPDLGALLFESRRAAGRI